VTITAQPLLAAERAPQRLAERDADILDRVMGVDVEVAAGFDLQVDQPVAGNLLEHVVEKRHAGGEAPLTTAIEVQANRDAGFERIPGNFCLPHRDTIAEGHVGSGKRFSWLSPGAGDDQQTQLDQ
jgi:hypothetical protein